MMGGGSPPRYPSHIIVNVPLMFTLHAKYFAFFKTSQNITKHHLSLSQRPNNYSIYFYYIIHGGGMSLIIAIKNKVCSTFISWILRLFRIRTLLPTVLRYICSLYHEIERPDMMFYTRAEQHIYIYEIVNINPFQNADESGEFQFRNLRFIYPVVV